MEYLIYYGGLLILAGIGILYAKRQRDADQKKMAQIGKWMKGMFTEIEEPITEELLDTLYFEPLSITGTDMWIYDSEVMTINAELVNGKWKAVTKINGIPYTVTTSKELSDLMKFQRKLENGIDPT